MKTVKILLLLIVISVQAQASGYSHNMFVAHRKLQPQKEIAQEKVVVKSLKAPAHSVAQKVQVSQVAKSAVTLNERILEEGPAAFFTASEAKEQDQSLVSSLIAAFKNMLTAFISAALRS